MDKREYVLEQNEDAIFLQETLDDAMIGIHNRFGSPATACYDLDIIGNRSMRLGCDSDHRPTIVKRLGPKERNGVFECSRGLFLATGHDDAIIGVAASPQREALFVVYDYEKFLEKLMVSGMSREEAVEFFDFNVIGAWVGPGTPGFITTFEDEIGEMPEPGLTGRPAKA